MTLVLFQVILQTISTSLQWVGFYVGVRGSTDQSSRRWAWIIGSAAVSAAWLIGIVLLASVDFFSNDVLPPRIPLAMVFTLAFGYLVLLPGTFRASIAAVPQHWLIGIQAFRVIGGLFLIRYFQGELPGLFAIPAGVGDLLTGISAPLVAYWWYSGKSYARVAAIVWNLFGMADLIDAATLGTLSGAVFLFPAVLIPIYGVPRAFLIHSYSLIGLLRRTSQQPMPGVDKALHYAHEPATSA